MRTLKQVSWPQNYQPDIQAGQIESLVNCILPTPDIQKLFRYYCFQRLCTSECFICKYFPATELC